MNEVKTETVTVEVADGTQMRLFVARPAPSDRSPAILVWQEAYGVNAHIRDVAARLAGEGYVAVAPELFHRTVAPGWEGAYGNFAAVQPTTRP